MSDTEDIEEDYGDSWLLALIRRNVTDIYERYGIKLTLYYNPPDGGMWCIYRKSRQDCPLITFRANTKEMRKGLAFTHGFECGCEHSG